MSRSPGHTSVTSSSSRSTRPESGFSRPRIARRVVVLPAPGGPEDGEELAVGDVERDVVHRRHGAEALAHALEPDACHQRTASPVASSKTCTCAGSKCSPSALPIAGRVVGRQHARARPCPRCSRCTTSFGPSGSTSVTCARIVASSEPGVDDAHALGPDRRRQAGCRVAALEDAAAIAERRRCPRRRAGRRRRSARG